MVTMNEDGKRHTISTENQDTMAQILKYLEGVNNIKITYEARGAITFESTCHLTTCTTLHILNQYLTQQIADLIKRK